MKRRKGHDPDKATPNLRVFIAPPRPQTAGHLTEEEKEAQAEAFMAEVMDALDAVPEMLVNARGVLPPESFAELANRAEKMMRRQARLLGFMAATKAALVEDN